MHFLKTILIWSEVWAPLIPLAVLLIKKKQPRFLKPVILYLLVALVLNLAADIIGDFKRFFPSWLQSNNLLYNVHSLLRFSCFSIFFLWLDQPFFKTGKKLLPLIFLLFVIINFLFFENFFNPNHLSGNLLSAESFLLMIYCLQYYFFKLKEEDESFEKEKDFWVVTGLCLFVTANFFIFLFYVPMITANPKLADNMWDVHDYVLVIFCILIAIAFYEPFRNKSTI